MSVGMNKLMTLLALFAWAIPGALFEARAEEGEYLTVNIPPLTGERTTIQITARNPDAKDRMGTIAVTIDGGGPVVPLNPNAYDVFPPDGSARLATFMPDGDGWKMRPRYEAVVASKMHVELYRDTWSSGAQNTLEFPVTFTKPGAIRILVRATFSKRVDGIAVVDWNFPKEGPSDEQGLPCEVFELFRDEEDDVTEEEASAIHPEEAGSDEPDTSSTAVSPSSDRLESTAEEERVYVEKAKEIVLSKTKRNIVYKVFQSLESGSLCTEGTWNALFEEFLFNGEDFYWLDTTKAYTADEEKFRNDLYWCGTYSYTTMVDEPRTLNAYTTDFETAVIMVRLNFGLYDDAPDEEEAPSSPEETDITIGGMGTGFFITAEGHILTNHHVVSGAGAVAVIVEGQEPRIAEIVGMDEETDLALLKVDAPAVPVTFGSTELARLGQTVFAIGFPSPEIQGVSPKVTMGIISSLTGLMDDAKSYQIDVAVQPGNSGGPLFSATGEVIGVVFARVDDAIYAEATGAIAQKINYAIKNGPVMAFLQTKPAVYERVLRGTVGVQTQEEAVSRISKSVVLIVVLKEKE
ncbi:MAG TPA: trypsin-like peptidase domain-containing protein [Candidatus Hydrogenedentes bacterium]|jgi:S1-C subfamily serine protease|nr:trypsin-like peptidase domain-containing protein [Candidatus Hydrogenedentota bacterium]